MTLTTLRLGDPAPALALPAVNREGQVSLDDYRGRSPVLVGLVPPYTDPSAGAGSCSSAPRRTSSSCGIGSWGAQCLSPSPYS